jgi:FkbM family methyltransferase
MKKILIAIPTARYIESDTFKSIYDLKIPKGYETTFQCFYGYRVDQVRNLIADWIVQGFDYLFAVDHDITFEPDTLEKMLSHDKPIVSGVYRQRLPIQLIEIYDKNLQRMSINQVTNNKLTEIGGCGFGCVLVKKEVMVKIGYPQFEYHHALNHNETFSEDNDFCRKARKAGFSIWCDSSILCGHIGSTTMKVELPQKNSIEQRLVELHDMPLLPAQHVEYLNKMKQDGIEPKVIYDIGSCVLHWFNRAKEVWTDANIIPFEAMDSVKFLYNEKNIKNYVTGYVLGDTDGDVVEFYENLEHPGGNSVYKENPELSPLADQLFGEDKKVKRTTRTLDSLVSEFNLPKPTLIKMDVQGSELSILKGSQETLKTCDDLILELQHKDYNFGAPKKQEVVDYLKEIGFEMVGDAFCGGVLGVDADYHFKKIMIYS